jgi:hypothetical protein
MVFDLVDLLYLQFFGHFVKLEQSFPFMENPLYFAELMFQQKTAFSVMFKTKKVFYENKRSYLMILKL